MKAIIDIQKERNCKYKVLKGNIVVTRPEIIEVWRRQKESPSKEEQRNNKTIYHLMKASYLALKWNTMIKRIPPMYQKDQFMIAGAMQGQRGTFGLHEQAESTRLKIYFYVTAI